MPSKHNSKTLSGKFMFAVKTFSNILLSQNKFQFAKNLAKSELCGEKLESSGNTKYKNMFRKLQIKTGNVSKNPTNPIKMVNSGKSRKIPINFLFV